MSGVPYIFANATTSIPLNQLDTNFATGITLGNTTVYLGNTTTSFANVTFTNTTLNAPVVAPNFTDNTTFGFKNRIINGAMMISQRGTSFSNPANQTYTLDRWLLETSGTTVASIAQVSGPTGYKNALQITGVSGNTFTGIEQRIESYNCSDLSGQTVTIQANIATSSAQTVAWQLSYANSQDNFSSTTVISSGTWSTTSTATVFTATVTGLPSGALNGLKLLFSPNNFGAFTSGTISITGVQLEKGSTATSFDYRPYGTELMLCQRYCQYAGSGASGSFDGNTTTTIQITEKCVVPMRASPSGAIFSGVTASFRFQASDLAAASPSLANFMANTSNYGGTSFWTQVNGFTGGAANAVVTARNNQTANGGNFILLTAEL